MQAETSRIAEASDALAVQRGADSLRRVLQHEEMVSPCDLQNVIHLRRTAGQVHRHNGACAVVNSVFQPLWVHISVVTYIYKNRLGAAKRNRRGRGNK